MAVSKKLYQPKPKKIEMNAKLPSKKSAKELFIVGIASASVFLSGSALALGNTNNSNSNQSFNNSTSLSDSTVKSKAVLAQTTPEDNQPPPPGDVNPRDNPPPPDRSPGGSPPPPPDGNRGVGSPPPPDAKPRGSAPPPTGNSPTENRSSAAASDPKPGTWSCINNPNPSCRG